jgi:hypothetical protein
MLAALEQAKATLRLEGIELTREELDLAERRAREGMSDEQFLKLVLELAARATPRKT